MEPSEFWALGDYAIVGDLWGAPGRDLAASLDIAGRDVVDLATGSGVTAIAIARRGARSVVGVDATPELLAEAARRAQKAEVDVDWVEADLAAVPLPDRSADLVTSTFGLIFAADPTTALAEARRLTRADGQIVFTSWSGPGLFGRLRQTLRPYLPESPEPWHESADGIRTIVGADAEIDERSFILAVDSAEHFVALLEQYSSPFILAAESLAERWSEARADLVEMVAAAADDDRDGFRSTVTYLVTTLSAH